MGLARDLKDAFTEPTTVDEEHPLRPRRRRMRLAAWTAAVVLLLVFVVGPLFWWLTGAMLGG